jgi:hypothetical protein
MQGFLTKVVSTALVLFVLSCAAPACTKAKEPVSSSTRGTGTASGPATNPAGGLGDQVEVVPGEVTLTISAASFDVGQTVTVLIANGLAKTIYASDAKSDCTLLTLQRLQAGSWLDLVGCAERRSPLTLAIGPSHGRKVSVATGSPNFAVTETIGPGTYRLAMTYGFDPQGGDEPEVAYSDQFVLS